MDFTIDTATPAVSASFDPTPDPRLREIMLGLTRHLHAFVREVSPTIDEWGSAIEFLTDVGQTCSTTRQEFILLSDVLGVSMLVETINGSGGAPREPGARTLPHPGAPGARARGPPRRDRR